MRKQVIAAAIALLVVAGLGVGYLAGDGARRTETITSTSTLVRTSTLTSQQTTASTVTVQNTVTLTTTSTVFTGQPIPVDRVETGNLTLGGSPGAIAVNPNNGRIYVADTSSNNLTVIWAPGQLVLSRIQLPATSNGRIAIDNSANMIYVLVRGGGVAVINGSTNKVVAELPLNLEGGSFAYDPTTRTIYGFPSTIQDPRLPPHGSLIAADALTGRILANISLGYSADNVAVDPKTDMVYALGCNASGVACNAEVSLINGTSESLVKTVDLGLFLSSILTVDSTTGVVYVSGNQLVALNGTSGETIYSVNPLECGAFDAMAVIQSSNQLAALSPNYSYVFVYDGSSGALVNMYALSGVPRSMAFNPITNEFYVTQQGNLLTFKSAASTGSVDSALVGSGRDCPLP